MSPHVVVDARMAHHSGIGTYIRNLVPRVARLEQSWRFTLLTGDAASWCTSPNVQRTHCGAGIYGVREQLEIPLHVPRDADLFWAPHYNVPALVGLPLVATIHDLAHLRLPEHTRNPLRQAYARGMYSVVRRRAVAVMCDSRFTHEECRDLLGGLNGRATVVHAGVDEDWFTVDGEPPTAEPYFVFVGNLKPHKNLRCVIEAMRLTDASWAPALVVIGRSEGMRTSDDSVLRAAATSQRIRYAGELPEAELRRYVKGAIALIFPSLYEGFGLPALEAMAAGTPVIASTAASIPEVCGDAAQFFDPRDPADLLRVMRRVASDADLRADLSRRGQARAREFSWAATAQATRNVLRRALESGRAN